MSRPRKPGPAREKPLPPKNSSGKPPPEELARDAIAREEAIGADTVRMTFRVVLSRRRAEALAARSIREEKNRITLVTEILEVAATKGRP